MTARVSRAIKDDGTPEFLLGEVRDVAHVVGVSSNRFHLRGGSMTGGDSANSPCQSVLNEGGFFLGTFFRGSVGCIPSNMIDPFSMTVGNRVFRVGAGIVNGLLSRRDEFDDPWAIRL